MQRFKDILFIAASDSECAATLAVNNQARLTVVRVIEEMPLELKLVDRVLSADDLQAEIVAKHRQRLEEQLVARNKDIEIEVSSARFSVMTMTWWSRWLKAADGWIGCLVVMTCTCYESALARCG